MTSAGYGLILKQSLQLLRKTNPKKARHETAQDHQAGHQPGNSLSR